MPRWLLRLSPGHRADVVSDGRDAKHVPLGVLVRSLSGKGLFMGPLPYRFDVGHASRNGLARA